MFNQSSIVKKDPGSVEECCTQFEVDVIGNVENFSELSDDEEPYNSWCWRLKVSAET